MNICVTLSNQRQYMDQTVPMCTVRKFTSRECTGDLGPEICIQLSSHIGASESGRMEFSTTAYFQIAIVQHLNCSSIGLLSCQVLIVLFCSS